MENSHRHINDILNYLANEMSERDRYVFERKMEADPFLMDAVEGYQNLDRAEVESQLRYLHSQLINKRKARIVPVWMRMAAAVLLLLGVGSLFLINTNTPKNNLLSDGVQHSTVEEDSLERLTLKAQSSELKVADVKPSADTQVVELEEVVSLPKESAVEMNRTIKVPVHADVAKRDDPQESVLMQSQTTRVKGKVKERAVQSNDVVLDTMVDDTAGKSKVIRIRGMALLRDTSRVVFSGRVVDEKGMPLPGVGVSNAGYGLVGSKPVDSVLTDTSGRFKIKLARNGAVLQLSFIGFKDRMAIVNNDSIGDLAMEPDNLALSEMVIVGNDTATKDDATMVPEPKGGVKRLVRKIERSLKYPSIDQDEKMAVVVEVFISTNGEVEKVLTVPKLDEEFTLSLEAKLKAAQWAVPTINGMPVRSNRKIDFVFSGR